MTVRTLVVLLVVAVGAGCAQPASRAGDAGARRIEARVSAVTDGDTLRVRATGSGRDYDVRPDRQFIPTFRPAMSVLGFGRATGARNDRWSTRLGMGVARRAVTGPSRVRAAPSEGGQFWGQPDSSLAKGLAALTQRRAAGGRRPHRLVRRISMRTRFDTAVPCRLWAALRLPRGR